MSEPQRPRCLRCGRLDKLERVAAVVRAGRSTSVVRGQMVDRYGYSVPVDAHVTQINSLARAWAPPARPRPVTATAIAVTIAGILTPNGLQKAGTGAASERTWLAVVIFATAAAAGIMALRKRSQLLPQERTVVEGAMTLWRWSWYCHRCAVVSVLGPNESTMLGTRNLASGLMELSRRTQQREFGISRQRSSI